MRDGERGAALSLKLAFRGAGAPCQPDFKLFYASGALIFHTVSSHDSLFPQRKIGGMEKKKVRGVSGDGGGGLPVIDWSAVCLNSGYEEREMGWWWGWGVEMVHSGGVCMLEPPREHVEELVIKRPRNTAAQSLVLHPVCRFIIAPFAFNNQLPLPSPPPHPPPISRVD